MLKQTWIATCLENSIVEREDARAPKLEELRSMVELILTPKTVRHTFLDELKNITLQDRSVHQIREQLENNFRLALPETEKASVELVLRS